MAQKTVRVRLNRTMNPVDGEKRFAGYETTLPAELAERWALNQRITILPPLKAPGRAQGGAADPTKAPPSGSPAGLGAQSSSSPPARQPRKPRST